MASDGDAAASPKEFKVGDTVIAYNQGMMYQAKVRSLARGARRGGSAR